MSENSYFAQYNSRIVRVQNGNLDKVRTKLAIVIVIYLSGKIDMKHVFIIFTD